MAFGFLWNGQAVPAARARMPEVSDNPTVQDKLWDAWCCIDALLACASHVAPGQISALEIADLIETPEFLESSPWAEALAPWLRDNEQHLVIYTCSA